MAVMLDTGTELFSNSESPCHPAASYQVSVQSDMVWEEMWFEKFQDSGHWNRTIVAILNLHNTPMPPIKFKLNPTYHS